MSDWRSREGQISGWSSVFRELCTNYFLRHIEPGSRVLDCGAGDGPVSFVLAEKGCHVDAIDARPERIEILEAEKGALNVNGICGDFFTHPLEPGSYDYVVSRQFLAHFPDRWRDVLVRKAELCKSGGALVFQHHSAECIDLSSRIAKGPAFKAAVERGYKTTGAVDKKALEQFCDSNGLTLADHTPMSFFGPRGILYRSGLSKPELRKFEEQMDKWLRLKDVHNFVYWFEEDVIAKLPESLSMSYLAVIRKI